MIREVTYYQAQCDRCGMVDDGGDFSAWSEADSARMSSCDSGWNEIEVRVPDSAEGASIYRHTPMSGDAPYSSRSILLCENCQGNGVAWCWRCEDDLDEAKWAVTIGGDAIVNTCPNLHPNTLILDSPDPRPSFVEYVPESGDPS